MNRNTREKAPPHTHTNTHAQTHTHTHTHLDTMHAVASMACGNVGDSLSGTQTLQHSCACTVITSTAQSAESTAEIEVDGQCRVQRKASARARAR